MKIKFVRIKESEYFDIYINGYLKLTFKYLKGFYDLQQKKEYEFESEFFVYTDGDYIIVATIRENTSYIENKLIGGDIHQLAKVEWTTQIEIYANMVRIGSRLYLVKDTMYLLSDNFHSIFYVTNGYDFKIEQQPLALYDKINYQPIVSSSQQKSFNGNFFNGTYTKGEKFLVVNTTDNKSIVFDSMFNRVVELNGYINSIFESGTDSRVFPNGYTFVHQDNYVVYKDFKPIFETPYQPILIKGMFVEDSDYLFTTRAVYKGFKKVTPVCNELYISKEILFKTKNGIFKLDDGIEEMFDEKYRILYYEDGWFIGKYSKNEDRYDLIHNDFILEYDSLVKIYPTAIVVRVSWSNYVCINKKTHEIIQREEMQTSSHRFVLLATAYGEYNQLLDTVTFEIKDIPAIKSNENHFNFYVESDLYVEKKKFEKYDFEVIDNGGNKYYRIPL